MRCSNIHKQNNIVKQKHSPELMAWAGIDAVSTRTRKHEIAGVISINKSLLRHCEHQLLDRNRALHKGERIRSVKEDQAEAKKLI